MKTCSFKTIASFMDSQHTTNSLRMLWNQHRHVENSPISFRNICDRHNNNSSKSFNFLCYNTWLLSAPLGNSKPVLRYRAYLIGKELASSKYDLSALTEVFDENEAEIIKSQSKIKNEAFGDQGDLIEKGGGLYTLSQFEIVNENRLEFTNDGSFSADAWSEKGVLHVELNVGPGNIDLYSTHLFYGTTFPSNNPLPEARRNRIRLAQVRELRDFIAATHKPENIAIIAGDFNITVEHSIGSPDINAKMNRILEKFRLNSGESIGFKDLWNSKGRGNGGTDNSYTKCKRQYTENGAVFCVETTIGSKGRIDYVFLENPSPTHNFKLDTTTLRRRPFPIPYLKLNHVIDMLVAVGMDRTLFNLLTNRSRFVRNRTVGQSSNPIPKFKRSEWILISKEIDLEQIINNYLIGQIKKQRNSINESKQLSDHIGLDTKLLVSRL